MLKKYSLIQAPMSGAQDADLTIAVCKAGEIGSLPAAMLSMPLLKLELKRIKEAVGKAPFNVNFFAHQEKIITDQQREEWNNTLKPYFDELGIDIKSIPKDSGRNPFNEEALQVIKEFRPPIVSFHFGLPEEELIKEVKNTGAQIWASATTIDEAKYLEAKGVDAIIAQGYEAGGHRGIFLNFDLSQQMGTFSLLPNIVATVKCPVIAAGGIATPTTLQAAFKLGASAVQIGTAFLVADEAKIRPEYKNALLDPSIKHTVITNLFSGGYARGLLNRFINELGPINKKALPFPDAGAATGVLKSAAEKTGNNDFSSFWAGQGVNLIKAGKAIDIINYLKSNGFE